MINFFLVQVRKQNFFTAGMELLIVSALLFLTDHPRVGETTAVYSFSFFVLGVLNYIKELVIDAK